MVNQSWINIRFSGSGFPIQYSTSLEKQPEIEFKEFEPWFKSAKTRFKLSAGLNLETFDTILSTYNIKIQLKVSLWVTLGLRYKRYFYSFLYDSSLLTRFFRVFKIQLQTFVLLTYFRKFNIFHVWSFIFMFTVYFLYCLHWTK